MHTVLNADVEYDDLMPVKRKNSARSIVYAFQSWILLVWFCGGRCIEC